MMNKNLADNRSILPLSLLGYIVSALLWISIGLVMRAVVVGGGADPLAQPDDAASTFLAMFASPLLAGIVFAALFAAIMSTSDAFLNIGTAAIIHDIPRAVRGRPVDNELFWARVITVVLAVVAAGFALFSYYRDATLVALLGAFGWSTFAASLFPVLAIGLNWKRATAAGAVAAVTSALLINFFVQLAGVTLPWGISGGLAAFVTSLMLFFAVSFATPPPTLARDIDRMMEI